VPLEPAGGAGGCLAGSSGQPRWPSLPRARTARSVYLDCEMQSIDSAATAGVPWVGGASASGAASGLLTIEIEDSTGASHMHSSIRLEGTPIVGHSPGGWAA
jgi:hypothetical protein